MMHFQRVSENQLFLSQIVQVMRLRVCFSYSCLPRPTPSVLLCTDERVSSSLLSAVLLDDTTSAGEYR